MNIQQQNKQKKTTSSLKQTKNWCNITCWETKQTAKTSRQI